MYVATLRDRSCPVRIVQSTTSGELALPERDEITVSWVNPASGLEWAVVVYVPGDPPLTPLGNISESQEPSADQPRGQSPSPVSLKSSRVLPLRSNPAATLTAVRQPFCLLKLGMFLLLPGRRKTPQLFAKKAHSRRVPVQ